MRKILNDSGRKDSALHGAVEEVTNSCETCLRYRRPHPRPAVSMPMAFVFNETVSADLKIWKSSYFFVLVDMCTRYCTAVVIPNKMPATIISTFFTR